MRRLTPSNQNRRGNTALPRIRRGWWRGLWQRQRWAILAVVLCGINLGCMGYLLYANYANGAYGAARQMAWEKFLQFSQRQGLTVRDIMVNGRHFTAKDDVWQALGIKPGDAILGVDLVTVQANLQILPWVAYASIERRLPGLIFITIAERQPLAIWQYKGELNVIDNNAAVILGAAAADFASLPVVVGADAPASAKQLLDQVSAHAELRSLLQSAVRVGQRRWDLRLQSGLIVKLPETNAELALERLIQLQTAQQIFQQDYVTIDLRLDDRIFLQKTGDTKPQITADGPGQGV